MSLSAATFDKAASEAMLAGAPPKDLYEALHVIERLKQAHLAVLRHMALAEGRRGDTVAKIPGLSDTLTCLLRRFAACGMVRHADFDDLYRHKSALCKALKSLAPEVRIKTVAKEGYEVISGHDGLVRLLHGGRIPSILIPGYTDKQSAILRHLAGRGSVHVDQFKALQRHMSNIRAKLPKSVHIITHPGEGLYTIDERSRDALNALISGEASFLPKPERRVALQLMAV